ncbi:MAG: MFS transporter [Alkalispirochaeta sp.]
MSSLAHDERFNLAPVLSLTGILIALFLGRMLLSPLLPAIQSFYELSHSQGGALFLAISIGYSVSTVASGFVARVLHHRGTVVLSIGVAGVALLVLGLAPPLALFRASLVLLGVGAGLYMPSGVSMLTDSAGSRHWGKGLAIHEIGPILGFFLAPLVAIAALQYATWRLPFLVLGAMCLVYGALFGRFATGGRFAGAPPTPRHILEIWRVGAFWVITLYFVLVVGLEIGVYSMLPTYLIQERELPARAANTLVSISRLSSLLLVFSSGWLADRFGARRLIGAVGLAAGACTVSIGLLRGMPLAAAVLLQPMLVSAFFPAGFAELARVTPESSRNVAVSLVIPAASLFGSGVVPAVMGRLAENDLFWLGFVILGGMMLASMALLPLLPAATNPVAHSG